MMKIAAISVVKHWFQKGECVIDEQPISGRPEETEDKELSDETATHMDSYGFKLARRLNIDYYNVIRHLNAKSSVTHKATC